MAKTTTFSLNGKSVTVAADDSRMLVHILRTDLGLTGTKLGCGAAMCGACTVVVNGAAIRSCSVPLADVAGKKVITIEGLERNGALHPLQKMFMDLHAFQCGFCTSGMILNAYALLLKKPHASRAEILAHMEGNLCRCGAQVRIVAAIEAAGVAQGGMK
jgi:aerobic-type carbon monoxide dehydrogenase small subunit (CoxS/CutS family)